MKFFFDRCMSCHIARMIHAFDRENTIVAQDDDGRFAPDSEDVFIINTLSAESPKPIWITADISQIRRPAERIALRESGMTVFFFKRNSGEFHFQAMKVLSVWPRIVEYAKTARAPTAFQVPSGRIGIINDKIDRLGPTRDLFR